MDEKPLVFDLQPVRLTDEEIIVHLRSEIEGTTMSENPNTELDTDQCSEFPLCRWDDDESLIDNEFNSGHVINPHILSEFQWQTIRDNLCQRENSLNGNRKYGFSRTRIDFQRISLKSNGIGKTIYSSTWCQKPIGYKRSLPFYHGHDTSDESSKLPVWMIMMHEFWLPGTNDHTRPPNQLELNRFPQRTVSPQEAEFSQVIFRISPADQRLCSSWMLQVVDEGATEEKLADNQSKGRVEDIAETCIDIEDRYPELATTNWSRQIDPNPSSADFFYIVVALILALTGQAAFTLIGLSSSTPTLSCAGALNVVGFIGALSAMLLRYRLPKVARYLGKVSVAIGAAAVVAVYAACFHPEITWSWGLLCGIALLIPSVAVLFA